MLALVGGVAWNSICTRRRQRIRKKQKQLPHQRSEESQLSQQATDVKREMSPRSHSASRYSEQQAGVDLFRNRSAAIAKRTRTHALTLLMCFFDSSLKSVVFVVAKVNDGPRRSS
jgi:hypothetical protein